MPLLTALAAVFAAWLAVGGACLGWGAAMTRVAGGKDVAPRPAMLFWAGFAGLIALLQAWHLLLPVDWRATAVLLGGGWIAAAATRAWRPLVAARPSAGHAAVLVVLALWIAFRALDFPRNYDSGLYHFSAVRWICEFPAVPGLANLHDRLGYNQSYFLFIALFNAHPFTNEGYHAANSLLWVTLTAQLLGGTWRVLRNPREAAAADIVQCLLVPAVLAQALQGDISSPTPDLAVFALGIAVFLLVANAVETRAPDAVAVVLFVVAAGCTVKLSFVAFGAACLGVVFFITRAAPGAPRVSRVAALAATAALAWGVPYAAHGIILSGYPAFPAAFLPWPVDWRLPANEAYESMQWVLAWGRLPGQPYQEVMGSWNWLGPWWHRTLATGDVQWTLGIAAVAIGGIAWAAARGRTPPSASRASGWLFAPLAAGLAYWFFTAPDPRFASWLFWLAADWLLVMAILRLRDRGPVALPRIFATAALVACAGVIAATPESALQSRRYGLHSFRRINVQEFVTTSGLKVIVPAANADVRLWDAPLPAAPQGKATLEARGATLREGFRTAPSHVSH